MSQSNVLYQINYIFVHTKHVPQKKKERTRIYTHTYTYATNREQKKERKEFVVNATKKERNDKIFFEIRHVGRVVKATHC